MDNTSLKARVSPGFFKKDQRFRGERAVNPYTLFLILILLIFSFGSGINGANPYLLFLILILLILGFG